MALETTLLVHGVPADAAPGLAAKLSEAVRAQGAEPALIGIVNGTPTVGMTDDELAVLLGAGEVPKVNTANLGIAIHRKTHGATTVSTTIELAALAGVRVFATGGIGGVHRDSAVTWDISSDLHALARWPVAVVTSGVKSILNVSGTREMLETLGVPVVGFRCDAFPAFYRRASEAGVDARFDDAADLAAFVAAELARNGRGVVIANPIPEPHEIGAADLDAWTDQAHAEATQQGIGGRAVTPFVLSRLHEISGGRTLGANVELALDNARLAGRVAAGMPREAAQGASPG